MGSRFGSLAGTAKLTRGSLATTESLPWSLGWNAVATADKSLPWQGEVGPWGCATIGNSGAAWGDTSRGSGVAIGTTSGVTAAIGTAIGTERSAAIGT
jgi:hypothetical protein